MRLAGVARVKNEADIIEEFVRYNLRVLDHLTIVDHGSFDATPAILRALSDEGLPLTIIDESTVTIAQGDSMTATAKALVATAAWDFLFCLDGDEFIKTGDRAALERALASLPARMNGLLTWHTYVPTASDAANETRVLARVRYRRTFEDRRATKVVLSRAFAETNDFTIVTGNHEVRDAALQRVGARLAAVVLAHFPVRSVAQLQGKILVGWGGQLARGYESRGIGYHVRELFDRLENEQAWANDDIADIARTYLIPPRTQVESNELIFDPLVPPPVTKYGTEANLSGMQLAARYVRQLARAVAARSESAS